MGCSLAKPTCKKMPHPKCRGTKADKGNQRDSVQGYRWDEGGTIETLCTETAAALKKSDLGLCRNRGGASNVSTLKGTRTSGNPL